MDKLIIFDLDGTLLYTLQDLTDSVNYALDKLSLPRHTCDSVRQMIGNGVVVLMQRAVGSRQDLAEAALKFQREYYLLHADDNVRPYDGIADALSKLKKAGFIVAVHTNKDENCAAPMCERHFGNLIDYVCGTTSNVTKPNPQKVLELMSSLGIDQSRTLYCGDSEVDIQTAANAQVKCISAAWGYRDENFLKARGATHIARKPHDVVELTRILLK